MCTRVCTVSVRAGSVHCLSEFNMHCLESESTKCALSTARGGECALSQ